MPNREERRARARANGLPAGTDIVTQLLVIDDDEAPLSDLIAAAVITGIGSLIEQGGAPLEHCNITLGSDHPSHPGKIVLEVTTDRHAAAATPLQNMGKPLTLADLRELRDALKASPTAPDPQAVVHLFPGKNDGDDVVVESGITLCCNVHSLGLPKGAKGTVDPAAVTCPDYTPQT